jgi:hypothetical protein
MEIPMCPECDERPVNPESDDFVCAWCRARKDGRMLKSPGQIYSVMVENYDENVAPPDRLLEVARTGGGNGYEPTIFIDVLEYEESTWDRKAKRRAIAGFTEESLVKALIALGVPIEYKPI